MLVQRITSLQEFTALETDWNCLTQGVPFRSWDWLYSWWNHYHAGRELCVLTVRDEGGVLVGVAPLFLEQRRGSGQVLQLLGSGIVCSDFLTVLSTPEHESEVVRHIGDWLLSEPCWDLLEIEGVSANDRPMQQLYAYLKDRGCALHHKMGLQTWRVALPGQFEEYLKRFPKSKRTKLRSGMRRLQDEGEGTLHRFRTADEIQQQWPVFVDLHQRRRISLGEPGCFACPQFSSFLLEAALRLAERGTTELALLELAGAPAAIDLAFISGGVQYIYQGGIDPDCLDESPGRKLTLWLIHEAIAQGLHGLDFLRGDEPYKQNWRAEPQGTMDTRVAPPRTLPQLRHRVWVAGAAVKDWLRDGMAMIGVRS